MKLLSQNIPCAPDEDGNLLAVVIPSHDPNVIFSLGNNRTSVIVFY
jgi:hypothetical protein